MYNNKCNDFPRVGIVIPSFNQGKYIERTIKSVLANKENCQIDIVVMDGGSTDNTLEILKKYAPYFLYWKSSPDNGQAEAINNGMQHLRHCDYVMWLNSDDEYENDHAVKTILDFAVRNNFYVAYGKSHLIDEEGIVIGDYPTEEYSQKKLGKNCYISQPSVIVSRLLWDKCNGLNPNLQMCLDYEFWIRLSQEVSFGYCPSFIGNTRIYENTKTATGQLRHLQEGITILGKYYNHVPRQWLFHYYVQTHSGESSAYKMSYLKKIYLLCIQKKIIQEADLSEELCLNM